MRVLLDTNVIIDRLLRRQPWYTEAVPFWRAVRARQIIGYVSASSVTDIHYIVRRLADAQTARRAVRGCLYAFRIWPVDRPLLLLADSYPGDDFEDNVQIACAVSAQLDAIVTRDSDGFGFAHLPILTPAEAVQRLQAQS